ncbi:D-glycero-beta-D-manno-heptose 1,7-bisphosphate 7-phosphatase [Thiorhodococcus fuscus]|uniref:D,D-heptose 1,7-bisphosphate phosphatase n=1 Tax=Thiorhodococcus fuscus TaxID=527200 RepID=A0ABW4YBP2_9GAMM
MRCPDLTGRAVILDRDGVINQDSDRYIRCLSDWRPIAGSIEAIARLSRAGLRIAVASNQSGLGRGYFSLVDLNAMHQRMRDLVSAQGGRIDMIAFCPHTPSDGCRCRKPGIALLEEIAERLSLDLAGVPFIGDSLSDIEAARSAGAFPILVRTGKGEKTLVSLDDEKNTKWGANLPIYRDLAAAADALLNNEGCL